MDERREREREKNAKESRVVLFVFTVVRFLWKRWFLYFLGFLLADELVVLVNGQSMGAHFSTATLDDATLALIKRKTRMKSSEITDWFNELKVRLNSDVRNSGSLIIDGAIR